MRKPKKLTKAEMESELKIKDAALQMVHDLLDIHSKACPWYLASHWLQIYDAILTPEMRNYDHYWFLKEGKKDGYE